MTKVKASITGKVLTTVTFIWMQGEADARLGHGAVYADCLRKLIGQIKEDLDCDSVSFVIGRLSDFGMQRQHVHHWTLVRNAQIAVADSDPRGAWVDTDDLNGPDDDLHYTKEGYTKLGERFAQKAIGLLTGAHGPARL